MPGSASRFDCRENHYGIYQSACAPRERLRDLDETERGRSACVPEYLLRMQKQTTRLFRSRRRRVRLIVRMRSPSPPSRRLFGALDLQINLPKTLFRGKWSFGLILLLTERLVWRGCD
jgi:hypothetical protein